MAAVPAAAILALLVPLVLRLTPREGTWLVTPVDLWLLSVFTLGILCVLFGLSARLGVRLRISTPRAPPSGSREREGPAPLPGRGTSAGALVKMGFGLLAIYTVGWLIVAGWPFAQ